MPVRPYSQFSSGYDMWKTTPPDIPDPDDDDDGYCDDERDLDPPDREVWESER